MSRLYYYGFGLLCAPFFLYFLLAFGKAQSAETTDKSPFDSDIETGAEQMHLYLHFLKGKRLALVVNHSSLVKERHLVDTLQALGVDIRRIFAPEHGFRGEADAGEQISNQRDKKTGIEIVSVYGKQKKPQPKELEDIDLILFDIQDVGLRFYTYTSTMSYMMEAAAQASLPFLVLDRPNPNGHYIDGPILQAAQRSFVGLHPVPIVHGLTVAEYARMINGQGWLGDSLRCDLYYVECRNYSHKQFYELPVAPSPNLRSMRSIYLYGSLCFFEGTTASLGRGTNKPFECYGHPQSSIGDYRFVPRSGPGSKYPPQEGKSCRGFDLSELPLRQLQQERSLNLSYLLTLYQALPKAEQARFFLKNKFFDLLAGNSILRQQIQQGLSAEAIRASWQEELYSYQSMRKNYLLYPDFE